MYICIRTYVYINYLYHLIYIVMAMEGIQSDQQCLALSRIVPLVDTFPPQRYLIHLTSVERYFLRNTTRKTFPASL